jgi:hypothetical protein
MTQRMSTHLTQLEARITELEHLAEEVIQLAKNLANGSPPGELPARKSLSLMRK